MVKKIILINGITYTIFYYTLILSQKIFNSIDILILLNSFILVLAFHLLKVNYTYKSIINKVKFVFFYYIPFVILYKLKINELHYIIITLILSWLVIDIVISRNVLLSIMYNFSLWITNYI